MPLAIQPSDFSQRVTDTNRNTWTVATMRYVVDALDGAQVTVVTDQRVGSAVTGTLIRAYNGGPASGPRLTIETEYAPGQFQRTNFYLPNVGVVIEMQFMGKAKFDALDAKREDESMALRYVRSTMDAEDAWKGEWTSKASGESDTVVVSREERGKFNYQSWTVRLNDIRPVVGKR